MVVIHSNFIYSYVVVNIREDTLYNYYQNNLPKLNLSYHILDTEL